MLKIYQTIGMIYAGDPDFQPIGGGAGTAAGKP